MLDFATLANGVAAAAPMPKELDMVEGRTVHIDGDAMCYWAAGKDDVAFGVARHVAVNKIMAFLTHSGAEHAILQLTGRGSTKGDRRLIARRKPYQGNRNNARRPKNWEPLRQNFETATYPDFLTKVWATREADDAFALYGHRDPEGTVIVTQDKDMRMVPGWHMDWNDYSMHFIPKGTFRKVGPNGKMYGHLWFWLQTLQGDTADNIPGLPRWYGKLCGEATAQKALEDVESNADAFSVVMAGYQAQYGDAWAEEFAEQAALLWMRTGPEAPLDDVMQILPPHPALTQAFANMTDRVKGLYAQAQAIGNPEVA